MKVHFTTLTVILFAFPVLLFFSCASKESALEEPPIITSATYQHTQYNGRNQPIEVTAAKDDVPVFIITYFTSLENLEKDEGGSVEVPSDVGNYYVRVERPAGNGYKAGKPIKVEYHIQKAFISIKADPVQRFTYDGRPKEAAVSTEPPVDMVPTYFAADGSGPLALPPVEKGHYRVNLAFTGNERYMGASQEIELWIE
ncbi:MAG: MBG domain-containing protein [Treponema sp.]|nr:MBG domain-containing protein [Treponema sp.]